MDVEIPQSSYTLNVQYILVLDLPSFSSYASILTAFYAMDSIELRLHTPTDLIRFCGTNEIGMYSRTI